MKNLTVLLFFIASLFVTAFSSAQEVLAGRGVEIRLQGVQPEEQNRINGTYFVSNDGKVRMPDVGEVHIAGLQTPAAAAKLDAAYKTAGIYTNPTFQVVATDDGDGPRKDTVTVAGFVRAPGPKPFTPGMTLFQAVAAGGGATEFGSMKRVLLMRGTSAQSYDLEVLQNRTIVLQRDDVIEVPEKTWTGK